MPATTDDQISRNESAKEERVDESPSQEVHSIDGILSLQMPAEEVIIHEAARLASDPNIHISDLSTCVAQDPVFVLELLRVANQGTAAKTIRSPVTNAQAAVIHLGSTRVLELAEELEGRPAIADPDVSQLFEKLRAQARRASIIAKILAIAIRKDLASEAQTVGLMTTIGHMLACHNFGRVYYDLTHNVPKATLVYRLAQDHHFDVRTRQLQYLQRHNFPESLLFALDRDATSNNTTRVALRHMTDASIEIVHAFDNQRWDRYKPGATLPGNSSIRLLPVNESLYEKIFERCDEYLQSTQQLEQARASGAKNSAQERIELESRQMLTEEEPRGKPEEEVAQEQPTKPAVRPSVTQTEIKSAAKTARPQLPAAPLPTPTQETEDSGSWSFGNILFPQPPPLVFQRFSEEDAENSADYFRYNKAAQVLMDDLSRLASEVEDTWHLVEALLRFLIDRKLFARVALLAVAVDRRSASVLRVVGQDLKEGNIIQLSDPFSPLAACTTAVRSFNTQATEDIAPLGVTSYALSPLDMGLRSPIILYADCGPAGSMSFETRRLFRFIVGFINSKLPTLPNEAADVQA